MDPVLLVSLGALMVGPVVASLLGRAPVARAAMEGFVVVSVVGLVLVHILPGSVELGGLAALAAAAAGVIVPVAMHRGFHARHDHGEDRHSHRHDGREVSAALVFALNALAVHAFLDGLSLTGWALQDPGATSLVVAVLLHRIPAGMAVWWFAQPRVGGAGAVGVLLLLCLATWAGFALVPGGLAAASGRGLGLFQALMAGSLLHVALDHGPHEPHARRGVAGAVGAVAGALVLVAMTLLEIGDTGRTWLEIIAICVVTGWVVARGRRGGT
jgi:hypothetical protein